ncbi:MAG: glycogen synthase GlgA [Gammaproteobacteria bacterium]|nr:glycogen synthase GlgA [Gammaproteobacteria bacterium]
MRILFASSEVFPLIKTGGLADVSSGLPIALQKLGEDIRIVMPAYPSALKNAGRTTVVAEFQTDFPGRVLQGKLPKTKVPVWFIDIPEYFERVGGPYSTASGDDWSDNAQRFAAFCNVVCQLANNQLGLDWAADVVHCNDWQTALVPALLAQQTTRPATVFTIHNMAYQGLFPASTFARLNLPAQLWSMNGLEFYNQLSFMKGGLVFADRINTVSPSYAQEITRAEFGCGLQDLLRYRQASLSGILNGIDDGEWNPAKDPHLAANYSVRQLDAKAANKAALQQAFGLPVRPDAPLIGMVGRMVEQKGYDWVLAALPALLAQDVQVVMLGSGDKTLQTALQNLAQQHPQQFSVRIGYSEPLAHLLEAGSDMFLMPSRFEPCGLNQIYSQRYGTVPIVHHVGGLIDSVIDTNEQTLREGTATGFHFYTGSAQAMTQTTLTAIDIYRNAKEIWHKLQLNGMKIDFGWKQSAVRYQALYQQALQTR